MEVVFHPEALVEYEDGLRYYAAIRTQLGRSFHDAVEAAVDTCSERPLTCASLEQDIRRCLTRVFPYALLYTIEPDKVLIVAVMHCHRQPGYWRHRISESR
ncbi:type II toxin-antitoxin system RelE/ParE family toxin [Rhodanobacter lindaniclasticus]